MIIIVSGSIDDYNLTTITFLNDYSNNDYTIENIVESNWCGFFKSNEIFDIIDLTGIINGITITNEQLDILIDNQENSSLLNAHQYKKYKKNRKYYELEFEAYNEYNYTGIQQQLEIPITGIYEIMARGGIGTEEAAQIKGRIRLLKGEKINIRVGGDTKPYSKSGFYDSTIYYGGGGGTYIVKDVDEPTDGDIIVIAGGSGNIWKKFTFVFSVPDPPPFNIKTAAQAKLYNIKNDNGIGGINNTSKAIGGGGGGFYTDGEDANSSIFSKLKGGISYMNGSNEVGTEGIGAYGGGGERGGGGGYTGGNINITPDYEVGYINYGKVKYGDGGTSYNNFDTRYGDVDYQHSFDGGFASIELIQVE